MASGSIYKDMLCFLSMCQIGLIYDATTVS